MGVRRCGKRGLSRRRFARAQLSRKPQKGQHRGRSSSRRGAAEGGEQAQPLVRVGRFGNVLVRQQLAELSWTGSRAGRFGLSEPPSKKALKVEENVKCIGDMRGPARAVKMIPGLWRVGSAVAAVFQSFAKMHPEALEVADNFGQKDFEGPSQELVVEWKRVLRDLVGGKGKAEPLDFVQWPCSLEDDIWERWLLVACDPEKSLEPWARQGVPLGIEVPIDVHGIFPKIEEERGDQAAPDVQEAFMSGLKNYTSFYDDYEGAKKEVERYLAAGYGIEVEWSKAMVKDPHGSISKLALIVKSKQDGTVKRLIIVDLRRSGANSKSVCPERIILPRISDAIQDLRQLAEDEPHAWQQAAAVEDDLDTWGCEAVSADFSDALLWRVDPRERYTVHYEKGWLIQWLFLCFGLKAALLLWGRLSAAGARMLQGLIPVLFIRSQVYLDDPLWLLVGTRRQRRKSLALLLPTACAIGLRVAWHKGERGHEITWIGVTIKIRWEDKLVFLEVPAKMIQEILSELKNILEASMVGVRRMLTIAGRLSWISGVVPRFRWAVCTVYAVVAAVDKDVAEGIEEQRRRCRLDSRDKAALVATNRCAVALRWVSALLLHFPGGLSREVSLRPAKGKWTSPWGGGALLCDTSSACVLEAFEVTWGPDDTANLGLVIWDSASQALPEFIYVFLAVVVWRAKLAQEGFAFQVRSDSTAALSATDKLAGKSVVTNFVAAELALRLEVMGVREVDVLHVPGVLNKTADWLSRRAEPGKSGDSEPDCLKGVKRRPVPDRDGSLFVLPLPIAGGKNLWDSAS